MKHVTRTPHGWQARIRLHGRRYTRHFPEGTPDYAIKRWLLTTQLRHGRPTAAASGRFDQDARAYLAAVAAMPSIATRTKHIEEWIEAFGPRQRDTITPPEIAACLHRWRTTPRQSPHGRHATRTVTLSPTAVNHRRTALMHLWTVLDGKHAPNPVRSVPKFREAPTAPKALPFPVIRRILRTIAPSKSKARLYVMAYTGLPPVQLAALRPSDVDIPGRLMTVPGRQKGSGTAASVRPLSRTAAAAFRLFARQQAWGRFSTAGLRDVFREACLRAKVPPSTPYVLRHSFGTRVLALTGDLHAAQALLGHSTPQQTQRYAQGARDARLQAAMTALEQGRKSDVVAKKLAKSREKARKTA